MRFALHASGGITFDGGFFRGGEPPVPVVPPTAVVLGGCLGRVLPREQIAGGPEPQGDGPQLFVFGAWAGGDLERLGLGHPDRRADSIPPAGFWRLAELVATVFAENLGWLERPRS